MRTQSANNIEELVDRFGGDDKNNDSTEEMRMETMRVQTEETPNACYANGRSVSRWRTQSLWYFPRNLFSNQFYRFYRILSAWIPVNAVLVNARKLRIFAWKRLSQRLHRKNRWWTVQLRHQVVWLSDKRYEIDQNLLNNHLIYCEMKWNSFQCYNAGHNECCPPLRCHGYYHHCVT